MSHRLSRITALFGGGPALLLTGCLVGPKYKTPTVQAPAAYKEPLPAYK